MILRSLVVDDELPAIEGLKYLLSDYKNTIEVIGTAKNGTEAFDKILSLKPDVVFLDINIPKLNGINVANNITSLDKVPLVVFVTAYDSYAIEAFEIGAIDYLLKPINPCRLNKTINKIVNMYDKPDMWQLYLDNETRFFEGQFHKLPVEKFGRIKLIDFNEIVYAEAKDGKVLVKTKNDIFDYNDTMKNLENRLNDALFFRVQKSFIVNLNKIVEILPWFKGTYWLVMDDDKKTKISVSKNKIKELKMIFGLEKN
ncbi:LytTR family DNA-binding domain-containing protein [Thermoanaerobacterium thermosaccharolyticum]|uniref:LytR/AlgR family response regulator transcription factor n=1 Tax=Thermoanaerobacterium thermosaccharolyticum TaxID=1517 RepID=UPI0020A4AE90|nr:LytTR family DNA-binding domain-containing protein [Thermoanaerobacterium thermosaccharolyticum]MCP2239002.1 two-component system response regulator LytT [Thermoanaerobacterium thermosaccharolyticum]